MRYFYRCLLLWVGLFAVVSAATAEPLADDPHQDEQLIGEQHLLDEQQLDQILAPVALYPDTLLSHILVAATYPLEVVQAARWRAEHKGLDEQQALAAAEDENWDPSVKALAPFHDLLQTMSEDLDWLEKLGNAFLLDEERVLAAVQKLRQRAYDHGSLTDNDYIDVEHDDGDIVIQPRQRDVVYVPYYDTRIVYGPWWWSSYPPYHWHQPHHYTWHSGFYWSNSYLVYSGFYFSSFSWRNRHLFVDYQWRRDHLYHHGARKLFDDHRHGAWRRWQHNPHHRHGVRYPRQHKTRLVDPRYSHSRDFHQRQFNPGEWRGRQLQRDDERPGSDRRWQGSSLHGQQRQDLDKYRPGKDRLDKDRFDRDRFDRDRLDKDRFGKNRFDKDKFDRDRFHRGSSGGDRSGTDRLGTDRREKSGHEPADRGQGERRERSVKIDKHSAGTAGVSNFRDSNFRDNNFRDSKYSNSKYNGSRYQGANDSRSDSHRGKQRSGNSPGRPDNASAGNRTVRGGSDLREPKDTQRSKGFRSGSEFRSGSKENTGSKARVERTAPPRQVSQPGRQVQQGRPVTQARPAAVSKVRHPKLHKTMERRLPRTDHPRFSNK
ncbi:DUF3300 domain-containing protein [Pseudomaricurvus alcaniphilus]|uniref:DUF3300 domain-containing protein n=1 Tax=Pseudomaricurvus alcaniphilus TaxID=1166482 RepID=UPI001A9D4011|nr:DUF3300 domain-containing protein [Pseudomaricurvus alcaniphilus]